MSSIDIDNCYYTVSVKMKSGSFRLTYHTLAEVYEYLQSSEQSGSIGGMDITIQQRYGWDEKEREELARLKAKYEPEVKS